MKDFKFTQNLWCVVKADGTFAGIPCVGYEEARDLSAQHEGSAIFYMDLDCDQVWEEDSDPYEPFDDNLECGFDPYMGCYTDDC